MTYRHGSFSRPVWIALTLLCIASSAHADVARLLGARIWNSPDGTRLVLDLTRAVQPKVSTLVDPHRVVIDIPGAKLATSFTKLKLQDTPIASVHHGMRRNRELRVVLTLKSPVVPRFAALKPNREYGHRLVVDLETGAPQPVAPPPTPPRSATARPSKSAKLAIARREAVVAIDAGHGGEDPGARGRLGTSEKDVALAIARQLHEIIQRESGLQSVLIREGDYYLPLRRRMDKARRQQADIFVSIHADAANNRKARGSSVYTLSSRGATSEAARWLADKENASDLVGGVRLEDKDDMLASVLLDLAQTATNDASQNLARHVLGNLRGIGPVHQSDVQSAAFAVLKSPDVPSILVETAFISNPAEERRLRSVAFQKQIAHAIFLGVKEFFERNPPANTVYAAQRRHVIEAGETLDNIARRYSVSLDRLMQTNGLHGTIIRPGQILQIPGASDS